MNEEIEKLKKENAELRKKLEDRNPAFNGNLLSQADKEYSRLQKAIGQAIFNAAGPDANGYYDGYFRTKAKAIKFMKNVRGTRQLFKVSYEFRDVMG